MTDKNTYYVVHVDIDTDDDFNLDIGDNLSTQADTLQGACDKMVQVLKDAKVTWSSKGSISNGGIVMQRWDMADNWYDIRNRSLRRLKRSVVPFEMGGNQRIHCHAVERSKSEDDEVAVAKAKLTERELELLRGVVGKPVTRSTTASLSAKYADFVLSGLLN